MTQRVVFFDIAGTLVIGNPWRFFLDHPDVDPGRVRMEKLRFVPVYLGNKLNLVSDVSFRHRWITGMARLMQGWTREQTRSVFDWIVNDCMDDLFHEDVLARLQEHQEAGDHVVLVSGMFEGLVQAFAGRVGADGAIGTRLAFVDDVCAGQIDGPSVMGPRKLSAIHHYLADCGFSRDLSSCYGYADSFSDVPLLEAVGHGVATYPDDNLRSLAVEHGWDILPA